MPHQPNGDGSFPSTRWTLIERAAADAKAGRPVLGELLSLYVRPLHAHLVSRRQLRPDQAEELVQGFIASRILEGELLARADRARGSRFRSFLLTSLDNYLVNQHRARRTLKRSPGGTEPRSLDGRVDVIERGTGGAPDRAFDAAWAREVVGQAVARMRDECDAKGRHDVWQVFEWRVMRPALSGERRLPYRELVRRAGLASPVQAGAALTTGKRMFRRILKRVVAAYAGDAPDAEQELRDLIRSLTSRQGASPP